MKVFGCPWSALKLSATESRFDLDQIVWVQYSFGIYVPLSNCKGSVRGFCSNLKKRNESVRPQKNLVFTRIFLLSRCCPQGLKVIN